MSNPSLRVALGNVAISLENASSTEDIKSVVSDLITALDDCICGDEENKEEGEE